MFGCSKSSKDATSRHLITAGVHLVKVKVHLVKVKVHLVQVKVHLVKVKVHLVKVKVHLVKWKFTLSGRATCCCWLIFDLLSSASVRMSGVLLGFLAKSIRGAASGLIGVSRRPRRIFKEPRKLLRGVMSTVVSSLPIQV